MQWSGIFKHNENIYKMSRKQGLREESKPTKRSHYS